MISLLEKKDEEIFKIAEPIWDNLVKSSNNKDIRSILESSEKWLKNLYLIDAIIDNRNNFEKNKYKIKINFDFPEWLKESKQPFDQFKKDATYELNYDFKKIDYIRNEIKTVQGDKERALGRYLDRRHMIGFDLFEKQFVRIN